METAMEFENVLRMGCSVMGSLAVWFELLHDFE